MKRLSLFFLVVMLAVCVFTLTSCFDLGGLGSGSGNHEHDMSEHSMIREPSCLEDGLASSTCSICGYSEEYTIGRYEHYEVILEGREATCSETGLTSGVECSECHTVLEEQEIIEKLPHTEQTVPGYAPTCTEEGLSDGVVCLICDEVIEKQVILPPQHNVETIIGYAPTCTEEGLSDYKVCLDCGEVIEEQVVLPPQHTEKTVPGYAPTCTEEGLSDGKVCRICDEVIEEQVILPPQHTEETVPGIPFTCTEDGLSDGKRCTLCGTVTLEQYVIPAAHVEMNVEGKDSTCIDTGLTDGKKCAVCDEVLVAQQTITQLKSHNYSGGKCTVCNSREPSRGIEYKLGSDGTYYYVKSKGTCNDTDIYIANQYNGLPVRHIGDSAFYGANIKSITIENGVIAISTKAFSYCEELESVFLPESLTDIYYNAFLNIRPVLYTKAKDKSHVNANSWNTSGCPVVWDYCTHGTTDDFKWATTNTNPDNAIIVGYIGADTEITIPATIDGKAVKKLGSYVFASREDITAINLPEGLVEIDTSAMAVSGITSITLPSSLKRIGTTAFKNAKSLTSCTIPEGVEFIGAEAFVGTSITEITIPDSVTDIGYGLFWECRELLCVTVGSGITVLYEKLFEDCNKLTTVNLRGEIKTIENDVFLRCYALDMEIPSTVEKIGDNAFSNCSSLKKIVIPDSVTELGSAAFRGCWSATEIVIGTGIKMLPQYTFQSCGSLTEVIIPRHISNLGSYAFSGCVALEFVFIPKEVVSIGTSTFNESPKLAIVAEAASRPNHWTWQIDQSTQNNHKRWNEANANVVWDAKEYGKTEDGLYWAVKNSTPDAATIVKYSGAATEVVIPESINGIAVTSIEWKAFINRDDITSVTIPDSVTQISFDPFDGCTNLTIYCEVAEQPANWYWVSDKYTFVWNHNF